MKVAPLQTWSGCVVAGLSYRLLGWYERSSFPLLTLWENKPERKKKSSSGTITQD